MPHATGKLSIAVVLFLGLILRPGLSMADIYERTGDQRTSLPRSVFGERKSWGSDLSAGYSQNAGNVESRLYNIGFSAFKIFDRMSVYNTNKLVYFKFEDVLIQKQGDTTLRADYRVAGTFSWFAFNTHAFNEFLLLDYRTILGTGPWYDLMGKKWKNGVSFAPAFFYEEFDGYPAERSVRLSWRNVFECALTDTATFGVDVFYAPKVNDFNDVQVFAGAFIESKIYKDSVGLKVTFDWEHDSRPKPTVKKNDTLLFTSLIFHMGK